VRIESKQPPERGVKLLSDGKPVAEITSAAYSEAFGEVVALAYVRREALQSKTLLTVADTTPEITARLA